MPQITEEEYQEYKQLQSWAEFQGVRQSAKDIENLEDDIDKPVKKLIALFALLGHKPMYSCCGFDYDGQPFHKCHQYGEPYIMFEHSSYTEDALVWIKDHFPEWYFRRRGDVLWLQYNGQGNPFWRDKNCIHFSEEMVIAIGRLEKLLLSPKAKESMKDSVIIEDTNLRAKDGNENWQYPPKKSWLVLKEIYT